MTKTIGKVLRNTLFVVLGAGGSLALAGCGSTIDEMGVRDIQTSGADFNSALAREYKKLAIYEKDQMTDWYSARRFGAKAVAAAKGKNPAPERIDEWQLSKAARKEIGAARERLISVLYAGAAGSAPQAAARAQAGLDCWAEQQEEGFQPEHIKRCRNGFFTALKETGLDRTGDSGGKTPMIKTDRAAETTRTFVIFFPFDGAAVSAADTGTLAIAARAAGKGGRVRVAIGGHSDRSGTEPYNAALAMRRAEAVYGGLVRQGVAAGRMTVQSFGESRPLEPTPDGRRLAHNRRVEITVGPTRALQKGL